MGYLLCWKYNLHDWRAIDLNTEWQVANVIFKSVESAQEAAMTEFTVERIEWREFNVGSQWRAKAMVQPLATVGFMGFMILELVEESEGE